VRSLARTEGVLLYRFLGTYVRAILCRCYTTGVASSALHDREQIGRAPSQAQDFGARLIGRANASTSATVSFAQSLPHEDSCDIQPCAQPALHAIIVQAKALNVPCAQAKRAANSFVLPILKRSWANSRVFKIRDRGEGG
jgi:hypothetical protein